VNRLSAEGKTLSTPGQAVAQPSASTTAPPAPQNYPNLGAALSEAQNIVEAARNRAADIELAARRSFEEARENGYREGFKAGEAKAADAAVRLIEETVVVGERLSEEAAALALAICQTIIGEHVKVAPETAKKIALRALKESVVGDSITIYVNPDDRKMMVSSIDELRRIAGGSNLTIEAEPLLARGGARVRTEFGEVDASIETLLGTVAQRLGIRQQK
jgi:type III secretion system HrpE/YscL family protein